jgi:hypothetical protein
MITLAVARSPHVVFAFSVIALIMLRAGIAAFVTGGMMAVTFGIQAGVLAIGIQAGAWAGIG